MNKFGKRSLEQLDTCHRDLKLIANEALKNSEIDFGISEGHRSFEDQLKYYEEGKSQIDPRNPRLRNKGRHLKTPSEAFDIYIWDSTNQVKAYDKESLTYVAGVIMTTAKYLYKFGKVGYRIKWGGNWDSDGVILRDQKLWDRPHFELIK